MKIKCDIYVKIGTDCFPIPPWTPENLNDIYPASGDEIYNFLLSDGMQAYPIESDLTPIYNFPKENEEWELQSSHGGDNYNLISPDEFKGNKYCNRCVYKHKTKDLFVWFSKPLEKIVLSDNNPINDNPGNILYVFEKIIDPCDYRLIGDKVIWYLCCSEKHGQIILGDKIWKWAWGESSPDIVKEFVTVMRNLKMISQKQYQELVGECEFAKNTFVLHYDIFDWLRHKKYGVPYKVDKYARQNSIAFHAIVNDTLEKKGWKIYTPNVNM